MTATLTVKNETNMKQLMQYSYKTVNALDMRKIKDESDNNSNNQNVIISNLKHRGKKMIIESMNVTSRILSILDIYTDSILLYKSTQNQVLLLTLLLFLSIISPYVLSYSSGVKLFIFRKTFDNLMGLKKILIILYLLPTGFLYFIFIDILDLLYSIWKWILYNICLKSEASLKILEEELAQQLGMDRMNYEGFKRQKTVAQLMFESIPQLIIQTLLLYNLFPVKSSEISNITETDLYRSITFAVLNAVGQFFKLFIESIAVDESFVQYCLHAMMSRVGWIPFKMKIIQYFRDESSSVSAYEDNKNNNEDNKNCLDKIFGVKYINPTDLNSEKEITINYKIDYRMPVISYLFNIKPTLEFDFSSITIRHLIAIIESQSNIDVDEDQDINYKDHDHDDDNDDNYYKPPKAKSLSIKFNESLRLLGVKDIILLMNTCKKSGIKLPDIDKIDWKQSFKISADSGNGLLDPRLLSNCKDQNGNPLLISLYLSGYDKDNKILYKFLQNDVPVHVFDNNGENIVFHMIQHMKKDHYEPLKLLFKLTKEEDHRMLLNTYNKSGHSPLFLALQKHITQIKYFNNDDTSDNDNEKENKKQFVIKIDEYKHEEDIKMEELSEKKTKKEFKAMEHEWTDDFVKALDYICDETIINAMHICFMRDMYCALDQLRNNFLLITFINEAVKYCAPYEGVKFTTTETRINKSKFEWNINIKNIDECDETHFIHILSVALDFFSDELSNRTTTETQNIQSTSVLHTPLVEIDIEMDELVVKVQNLRINGKAFSSLSEIQFVEKMIADDIEDDVKDAIDEKHEQNTDNRRLLYAELYRHIRKIDIESIPNYFIDIFINNCEQKNVNKEMMQHINKFKEDRNVNGLTTAMQTIADNNDIEDFGPKGKYFAMYHNILSKRFLRIEEAQKSFEERLERYKKKK
eukprot:365983_1